MLDSKLNYFDTFIINYNQLGEYFSTKSLNKFLFGNT